LQLAADPLLHADLRARGQVRARDFDVASIAGEYVEVLANAGAAAAPHASEHPAATL
jgi:hypothetical protein